LSKLISKCGMNCGACPWGPYPRKDMTAAEFEQFKKKAKAILGYQPIVKACVTCQTLNEKIPKESKLPPRSCLIRQCVDKIGVANCAYCARFPCQAEISTGGLWNRSKFEEKLGAPVSEEDYHAFIEPFEALNRLEGIRAKLKPKEIVEPPKVPAANVKIIEFPKNLLFSKEETTAFKTVHKLFERINQSQLGLTDTDTFAQQRRLGSRKAHILRFLWIMACFGENKKENATFLEVDAKTFLANRGNEKTLAIWSFLKDTVFKVLLDFGLHCERVSVKGIKEKGLETGTGYMRDKGWIMKMSLDKKVGEATGVKALQKYAKKLDVKYGKKAFNHFSEADMHVLIE
jgi:hypothetical protein